MRTVFFFCWAAWLFLGCSSPPPNPTPVASTSAPLAPGQKDYNSSCASCHGKAGEGVPNLGKALVGSPMLTQSDEELAAFIEKGRMPNDPANTTGQLMPPKGGNAKLTHEQILAIVTYVKGLSSPAR
jgi:mono/diheme cytochrome c family protein